MAKRRATTTRVEIASFKGVSVFFVLADELEGY
jgi:hypothetical protein